METVRSSLEVADILRASLDSYRSRQRLSPEQATVVRHLVTAGCDAPFPGLSRQELTV